VLSFAGEGVYTLRARLDYRVGVSALSAGPAVLDVGVGVEPPPHDGGTDGDGGAGDGSGDGSGGDGGGPSGGGRGCGCRAAEPPSAFTLWGVLGAATLLRLRRRR
jgi:MYXO-CTERM domain-containing protein